MTFVRGISTQCLVTVTASVSDVVSGTASTTISVMPYNLNAISVIVLAISLGVVSSEIKILGTQKSTVKSLTSLRNKELEITCAY